MKRKPLYIRKLPLLLLLLPGLTGMLSAQIRDPGRAGTFYSARPAELKNNLEQLFSSAKPAAVQSGAIRAIWVPHAGYQFSGQIAANAWYSVKGISYDAVIIVAPSHSIDLQGISVGMYDAYRTPLGEVSVHRELAEKIMKQADRAVFNPEAHRFEHAVEVQIPFIQSLLPGVPVVPILVGRLDSGEAKDLARTLHAAARGMNVLFAASSDMSHYPSYDQALRVDGRVLNAVEDFDIVKIDHLTRSLLRDNTPGLTCVLCGWPALQTVMWTAKRFKAGNAEILPYANSGDISGERQRVVGYGAAVFFDKSGKTKKGRDPMESIDFSSAEKKKMFAIARSAISAALRGDPLPAADEAEDNLLLKRGVFVTLTNKGQLRGCIGNFDPAYPLWEMIARMAAAAATQDYRFALNPVTEAEMDAISIKISILSEMKKIDSIEEIEIGRHGIWIRQGSRSGTYLPEVAVEMGWDREEFLSHCASEKAGLAPDAWKKNADIYIYSSQIIEERGL